MRFAVESWSADYGAPVDWDPEPEGQGGPPPDVSIEVPAEEWRPIDPGCPSVDRVVFIDGVQHVDARVWLADDAGFSKLGMCASYAAGAVVCDGAASIAAANRRRSVFGPDGFETIDCGEGVCYECMPVVDGSPNGLSNALMAARDSLEVEVARLAPSGDIVVVDGHLWQRETIKNAVGFIKTHHTAYLTPEQGIVVGRLAPGQRTPVFLLEAARGGYTRYSWYLKLPGGAGHPWAGVVRCEASRTLSTQEVIAFADRVSATLPRFASQAYKDPRAPQNLYPVAGLERELRRRLGDTAVLVRALQRASRSA